MKFALVSWLDVALSSFAFPVFSFNFLLPPISPNRPRTDPPDLHSVHFRSRWCPLRSLTWFLKFSLPHFVQVDSVLHYIRNLQSFFYFLSAIHFFITPTTIQIFLLPFSFFFYRQKITKKGFDLLPFCEKGIETFFLHLIFFRNKKKKLTRPVIAKLHFPFHTIALIHIHIYMYKSIFPPVFIYSLYTPTHAILYSIFFFFKFPKQKYFPIFLLLSVRWLVIVYFSFISQ